MLPNKTRVLIEMIGSTFCSQECDRGILSGYDMKQLYEHAFDNRVELLFLRAADRLGLCDEFTEEREKMEERSKLTRWIAAQTSRILSDADVEHVVFKSIKPYPATPNDTDIICMHGEQDYQNGIRAMEKAGYVVYEHAPMQTLLYHPLGKGKVGKGKKGGTYYIDWYRGVAVDYYEYVDKKRLRPFIEKKTIEDTDVLLLAAEPELAIVLFHNVFPEKTFQLEHFYLCLYGMVKDTFSVSKFIEYVEQNHMSRAVRCNLTIVDILHRNVFGFSPAPISMLLERWGRDGAVEQALVERESQTTFIFPKSVFWLVFLSKFGDRYSRHSILRQLYHMLNPKFFIETISALLHRTFDEDIYEHK